MATELRRWASIEREFLRNDIHLLIAGGKLISPSGDDITAEKLKELKARLEHAEKAVSEAGRADA